MLISWYHDIMISICSLRDVWGRGYTPSFHICCWVKCVSCLELHWWCCSDLEDCCNVGLNENWQRYCGFLVVHHHDKVLVTVDKGDKDDDVVLLCAWGGGGYMLSLLCLGELHSELPTVEKCTFLSKYLYGQRPSSAFTCFFSLQFSQICVLPKTIFAGSGGLQY